MNILHKIEELEVVTKKIIEFPDDMFKSNVLSPQEVKESFYEDFLDLQNRLREVASEADSQIELCNRELQNLQKGQPVRAFAFI